MAVETNAVVAGAFPEFPAVCVANVYEAPVHPCVPVHVFVADFKLDIAVPTKAVVAGAFEELVAVCVANVYAAPCILVFLSMCL